MTDCGGCRGLGAHQKYCPRHPNYHPWRRLADQAENIGDLIGSNDTAIANAAYSLSGRIKAAMEDHPYRRMFPLEVEERDEEGRTDPG